MNQFWTQILLGFAQIAGQAMLLMTPGVKASLSSALQAQYLKALDTPNPWDDFTVGLLLDALGIPRPPPE